MNAELDPIIVKAIELVTKAVEEDRNRNYSKALQLYEHSAEYFLHAINDDTQSPEIKESIQEKLYQYLERAGKIRTFLKKKFEDNGNCLHDGNESDSSADTTDKLQSQIKDAIVTDKPCVKWSDVAGLDSAKETLHEVIKFPNHFAGQSLPWKGILLFGPSGTGKTYLAKAVATQAESLTFFAVSSAELVSNWLGESENFMKYLFELARSHKPSIIFIDEIDALYSRSEKESESSKRMRTEFLMQMQGFGNGILVLGATSAPWLLVADMLGRFEKKIYIPLPDESARLTMFKMYLKTQLSEENFRQLAKKTVGYSGADISSVMRDALMQPLTKMQMTTYFKRVRGPSPTDLSVIVDDLLTPCHPEDPHAINMSWMDVPSDKLLVPDVSMEDILMSLESMRPTVSKEELKKFKKFRKEYKSSCSLF